MKKTIGIDTRMFGPKATGIGRYTKNLITNLLKIDQNNNYVLFGNPDDLIPLAKHSNVNIVKLDSKIYSIKEQIINPAVFYQNKIDLLHVPHFNVPLIYNQPFIATVHDLIKHFSTGPETTTLPKWQYQIKHLGYKSIVNHSLNRSKHVITSSQYWKNYFIEHLGIDQNKVSVIYDAADNNLKPVTKIKKGIASTYGLTKPFIIYTGNLYPHKNIKILLEGLKLYNQVSEHKLTLGIVCSRSIFEKNLEKSDYVKFLGHVNDQDLPDLYSHAIALVQPSLIEGFGLTGIEAMHLGLPVLSSNSSCLPEVYQDAALYFDPYSKEDLKEKLSWIVKDEQLRKGLILRGLKRSSEFSWLKTAEQTLSVYQKVLLAK